MPHLADMMRDACAGEGWIDILDETKISRKNVGMNE
jgi:hypothetical protein